MQASIDHIRARRPAHRSPFFATCFAIFTLILLGGYALLGKGFAYIGIPPYGYVGELGLWLGTMTLCTVVHRGLWRSSVAWLLSAFMAWGFACTIPYIGTFGIDALRDAVIWGYGIYALAVATVVLRFNAFEKVTELYGRVLPIFLILAPVLFALYFFANDLLPELPWSPEDQAGIVPKAGDFGVHYAGAFPFIAFGLFESVMGIPLLLLWVVGACPLVAYSRGALVTIAAVVGVAVLARPTLRTFYSLMIAAICLILVFFTMLAGDADFSLNNRRSLSVDQIWENIESIFSNDVRPDLDLEGTKRWRQMWWDKIVDYTFEGEYFWTGKGFGINLADADGFQTDLRSHSVRSPHNGSMTILARSGVPGLLLWVTLQSTFALKLLLNFFRDLRASRSRLAAMEFWILLYWLAFIINGTFDVFLEGPQGGIWFWCVFGFGLALIAGRRQLVSTTSSLRSDGQARPHHPFAGAVGR